MSNPTALPRVRSVVPSVEFEIGGEVLTLRYNFAALHAAGANPFDGSLSTMLQKMTPESAVHFLHCGMTPKDREAWPPDRILPDLDMMAIAGVIGALGKQTEDAARASGLPTVEDANPPVA